LIGYRRLDWREKAEGKESFLSRQVIHDGKTALVTKSSLSVSSCRGPSNFSPFEFFAPLEERFFNVLAGARALPPVWIERKIWHQTPLLSAILHTGDNLFLTALQYLEEELEKMKN
jgi:hypothetical protein